MPNVALTPTPFGWVPGQAGVLLSGAGMTSLAAATTVTFPNYSGNVILILANGAASTVVVQPVPVRTVEQTNIVMPSYTLPATTTMAFGPFPPNDFNVAGIMTVNVAGVALLTGGAFQMTTAPSQL